MMKIRVSNASTKSRFHLRTHLCNSTSINDPKIVSQFHWMRRYARSPEFVLVPSIDRYRGKAQVMQTLTSSLHVMWIWRSWGHFRSARTTAAHFALSQIIPLHFHCAFASAKCSKFRGNFNLNNNNLRRKIAICNIFVFICGGIYRVTLKYSYLFFFFVEKKKKRKLANRFLLAYAHAGSVIQSYEFNARFLAVFRFQFFFWFRVDTASSYRVGSDMPIRITIFTASIDTKALGYHHQRNV